MRIYLSAKMYGVKQLEDSEYKLNILISYTDKSIHKYLNGKKKYTKITTDKKEE